MIERWEPMPWIGAEFYISEFGSIQNRGRERKTSTDRYGYKRLSYRVDGKAMFPTVHSLVARVFIGPRPDGLEVAHLDGDKANNHYTNLAYVTQAENLRHSLEHGTQVTGERHGSHKLSEAVIELIRSSYQKGHHEFGTRGQAKKFGVDPATIRRALNGKNWTGGRHTDLRAARAAINAGASNDRK